MGDALLQLGLRLLIFSLFHERTGERGDVLGHLLTVLAEGHAVDLHHVLEVCGGAGVVLLRLAQQAEIEVTFGRLAVLRAKDALADAGGALVAALRLVVLAQLGAGATHIVIGVRHFRMDVAKGDLGALQVIAKDRHGIVHLALTFEREGVVRI